MIEFRRAPKALLPLPASRSQRSPRARFGVVALLACTFGLAACADDEEDEDNDAFVVRSTGHAAASGATELLGDGNWLAYLLSEAGQGASGTDFNEDGDTLDSIAVRVNTSNQSREVLDVAAESVQFARRTLFFVVSEAQDGRDWTGDADQTDRVLLYLTPTATNPVFLDELQGGTTSPAIAIGGTVIYASADVPTLEFETNLKTVTVASGGAAPTAPSAVLTGTDPMTDGVTFTLRGRNGDIVFLSADEGVDGDLNGDADAADTRIFAVLDAGAASPEATRTGLSMSPSSTPTAVPVTGGGEWLVAFLVDEAAQGENLNDPSLFSAAWQPANCAAAPDTDQMDHVLHWFQLTDLTMNTGAVNTGLVGASNGTAYALRSGFAGVVSPEDNEGNGGCDLNGDSDATDSIFRWVAAQNPAEPPLPVTSPTRLLAVDTTIAGGSGGVVRMADTFVLNVDEAADGRDHDGDMTTDREVVAAHNPTAAGQAWNFLHGSMSTRPIAVTWMREDPESASRFFAALDEEIGTLISGSTGDLNGDGDAADSVPTVPRVHSGNQLTFPGIAFSTSRTNSGLTVEENVGYHRVNEADEGGADLNGDGDSNDLVIQRFSLVPPFNRPLMGTGSSAGGPAVSTGTGDAAFGAFLTEEFQEGADFNGDGDTADFVVRYFRLP